MTSTVTIRTKHKHTDPEKIKEYHLKTLYELSLKSIGEIPQLDSLNEEQSQWIKKKRFHNYK